MRQKETDFTPTALQTASKAQNPTNFTNIFPLLPQLPKMKKEKKIENIPVNEALLKIAQKNMNTELCVL